MTMKRPVLRFQCLPFDLLDAGRLYQIMTLRQEVFVVEQACAYLDADGKDLLCHHILGYHPDGRLWAYARIIPPGLSYEGYVSIGRVVTAPEARRFGYGRELMAESVAYIESLYGKAPVKISAQAYLIGFYASFGFKTVGEEYLEDGIPHIGMVRGGG